MSNKVKQYQNTPVKTPQNNRSNIPQYKELGIQPVRQDLGGQANQNIMAIPASAGRRTREVIHTSNVQPYAQQPTSTIGRGRGSIPNVGNSIEQTWSGVDSKIIGDLSDIDPNEPMIDNNEYVSSDPSELSQEETYVKGNNFVSQYVSNAHSNESNTQVTLKDQYLSSILQQLDEEEYLLLVNGDCICSGPLEYIQEQTRSLVFGEHELCNGEPIQVDGIAILKRVAIKVGVFLS